MVDVRDIRKLMLDDEFGQRNTLIGMGDAAVEPLVRLARNSEEPLLMRQRSLYVLGEMASQGAADSVRSLLSNEERVIRLFAARALTKIRGEDAATDLEVLLEDPDTSVRKVAMQCLARVGGEHTIAVLEQAATQQAQSKLKQVAEKAITQIKQRLET